MSGDPLDPSQEDGKQADAQPRTGTAGASASRPSRPSQRENPLEALALRGSCVKDGGVAHAMLLVPMRSEQRQLLPRELPRRLEARLRAIVRWQTLCMAPQPWHGHELEREMMRLQADRQLALAAVQRRGMAIQRVPEELRDKKLVLAAVHSRARALEFAPPQLQSDREVILAALSAPGAQRALAFATPFSEDEEVQAAVEQVRLRQDSKKRAHEDRLLMDSEPRLLREQVCFLSPSIIAILA